MISLKTNTLLNYAGLTFLIMMFAACTSLNDEINNEVSSDNGQPEAVMSATNSDAPATPTLETHSTPPATRVPDEINTSTQTPIGQDEVDNPFGAIRGTAESTATSTSSPTPEPTMTLTSVPYADPVGPFVALYVEDFSNGGYSLVVHDISTGYYRKFWNWSRTQDTHEDIIGFAWSIDGCRLNAILTDYQDRLTLATYNLLGERISEIDISSIQDWSPDIEVSPDENWVAHTLWSGEWREGCSEFQDVIVRPLLPELGEPTRFTFSSWTPYPAWSPNSQHVAFVDFDEAGFRQLFQAHPDGSNRVQLTHFDTTTEILSVNDIIWSADSEKLAFLVRMAATDERRVWRVNADGTDLRVTDTEGIRRLFGWTHNGQNIAVDEDSSGVIIWIDDESGEQTHRFEPRAQSIGYELIFPLGGAETIVLMGEEVYLYSLDHQEITGPLPSPLDFEQQWIIIDSPDYRPSPITFTDVSSCGY